MSVREEYLAKRSLWFALREHDSQIATGDNRRSLGSD